MKRLLFLSCLLCFFSCQKSDSFCQFEGWKMTMPYHIIIGEKLSKSEILALQKIIDETFSEIDATYNNWNPNSELSQLNLLRANKEKIISSQLYQFFQIVSKIVSLTDGRFDPTVGSLSLQAFSENYPSGFNLIGWDHIHIKDLSFSKDDPRITIDFCGVVKGYCIDLLIERFQERGINNAFVEWAGEIRAIGRHPAKRAWTYQLQGDLDKKIYPLDNCAIATSGDTLLHWSVQAKKSPDNQTHNFFHIINPKENRFLEIDQTNISSVSVMAPNCALADALATAAMTFSDLQKAKKWAEKMTEIDEDVTFWFAYREKS